MKVDYLPLRHGIEVSAVTMTDSLVVASPWLSAVIGGTVLAALIASALLLRVRAKHRRSEAAAVARCRGMVAEALVVRQRVAGKIDSDTYQQLMNDLAAGRRP
ncbi:hypothetical protein [Mycolicibacterium sp.]|uniref:hypothetical protein n=1 Tax=Mycolicibacterium sp. TaxID=2320850 RepID=UPI0037C67AD9